MAEETRRRRLRLLSVVAAANLVAIGLAAAPSEAHGVSLCSGTAENFTVSGDLAVPAGASCVLVNSTVRGAVVVREDANLTLEGSQVRRGITVRTNGFVTGTGASVGGAITLRQAFGAAFVDSELDGGVNALGSGFFFSDGTEQGSVVSGTGQTIVLSGQVSGNIRTTMDLLTDVQDTVVTGGLSVTQAELGSVVCRSEIDDDVVLSGNGDVIQLGTGAAVADCEFNVFGDDVTIRDNTAEIAIGGNVVRGDLDCTGNATAPTGADNRIRGAATGQCAELSPVLAGFGATAADSRIAGVTGDIEARSSAAAAAADATGPAF